MNAVMLTEDASGEEFTREVARSCAGQGIQIVSGGARGVDKTAMLAALQAGGTSLGVLADSLLRSAVARDYRDHIRQDRLALVSACSPDARFTVGSAMGRNKQIYALADSALVISAETGRGGTWAGATEELKRAGRRPVFVRVGEDVPDGNRELTKLGARPFPPPPWEEDLAARLSEEQGTDSPGIAIQQSLFDDAVPRSSTPAVEEDRPDDYGRAVEAASGSAPTGVFAAVLPLLLQTLPDWRSPKDVASDLEVRKTQAEDWLRRAAAEGWVERKERPVQYRRSDRSPE